MLPAAHRMRRSRDFDSAVRRGRRAGRRTLVVHASWQPGDTVDRSAGGVGDDRVPSRSRAPRVGFVVSRAVGTAVVRNQVKRRLRAVLAARLGQLPEGLLLVVRANPPSARASSAVLAADLDAVLPRVLGRVLAARPGESEVL